MHGFHSWQKWITIAVVAVVGVSVLLILYRTQSIESKEHEVVQLVPDEHEDEDDDEKEQAEHEKKSAAESKKASFDRYAGQTSSPNENNDENDAMQLPAPTQSVDTEPIIQASTNAGQHDEKTINRADSIEQLPNKQTRSIESLEMKWVESDSNGSTQNAVDSATVVEISPASNSNNGSSKEEESPVIVTDADTDSTKNDASKHTDFTEQEFEVIEAAESKEEDTQALHARIARYQSIADKVKKLKRFDYRNGGVRVKLLKATNVDDEDWGRNDWSDVYVKLEVSNAARHEQSTIKKDKVNPVWNETFQLEVPNALTDVLSLTVIDYDASPMDNDVIGVAVIDVIEVVRSDNSIIENKSLKVVGSKGGCTIYVDLEYFEDEGFTHVVKMNTANTQPVLVENT